jgi:sugar phosphate isomerase/epimerase
MCWPPGGVDRRYAGVTHIDVTRFTADDAGRIQDLLQTHDVHLSGLGYYPNPLDQDTAVRTIVIEHLKKVIRAAGMLEIRLVNTFIGRDPAKSIEANWPLFQQIWPDIVQVAEAEGVKLGIENCPMLFSNDEWPGGKNLATSPTLWRAIFDAIPSPHLGLNFDPSHLVWQQIDCARCIREFGPRIFHVHAKDERIDRDCLYSRGIFGLGWHGAKLPGLGEVKWAEMFAALTDVRYQGPICIEVEDPAYEGTLEDRKRALRQSKRFLEQFV